MKSYKQRYEEMNKYYLDRIRKLQSQLHAEKIAREQIDMLYQGYVAELIRKYGLPDGTAFIEPRNVCIQTEIIAERLADGRVCLRIMDKPVGENKTE